MRTTLQRYQASLLAEAVGTYVLVLAGCGAIVVDELSNGRVTPVGIALSFGLAIGIMIAAVGHISGAHFNPAVSLALAVHRDLPARLLLPYWAAQIGGGLLGAFSLRALFGPVHGLGVTLPAGAAAQSFGLEVLLTAMLVFVIAATALHPDANPTLAAPAIGGVVALAALFAGPISGASMNPARSLGPALASGQFDSLWIYLTAPLLGGLLGIALYHLLVQTQ